MSSIIKVVEYFLPKDASIVNIQNEKVTKEEEQEAAIVYEDFNGDGTGKILAVYERRGKKYLMGLKKERAGWNSIFYKEIAYKEISYFKIHHLENDEKYELIIGGKGIVGDKKEVRVLAWKGEEVIKIGTTLAFDRLDIKRLENQEALILWLETKKECYDIEVYTYKNNKLQPTPELEKAYGAYVISYYETLKAMYPEESIYETYLIEALKKWGDRNKTYKMTLLEGCTAHFEDQEEDVFLLGKQMEDYIQKLQLIITGGHKKQRHLVNLDVEKVYDYQLRVGKFFEGDTEQVFIKVNANTPLAVSKAWIIGLEKNEIKFYLNEEEYYLEDDLKRGAYLSTEDEEGIEMRGEVFIVDLNLNERYTLCIRHRVWSEKNKCLLGYMVRWLRGQMGAFNCYKVYIMLEQKGE